MKKLPHKYPYLLIITIFFGCNSETNKPESVSATPEVIQTDTVSKLTFPVQQLIIDNGEEEGWGADLRLSITEMESFRDSTIYKTNCEYKKRHLGFDLIVLPLKKILIIKSAGDKSNNLLKTLSAFYKIKPDTPKQFISSVSVPYIDLHQFATTRLGVADTSGRMAPIEYKLFFEGQTEQEYAEFYININDKEHWLELREKDPEYRPFILAYLSKP